MATPSPSTNQNPAPISSILIIGAGVFGLSTTLSLLTSSRYAHTNLTLLDPYLPPTTLSPPPPPPPPPHSSPQRHQNPHAASIDSSRIIRPDYALPPYANLAAQAQKEWRRGTFLGIGGGGGEKKEVYRESGLLLTAEKEGSKYVRDAMRNAEMLGCRVVGLKGREGVARVLGTGGEGGEEGYVNWGSGWADAGVAMEGFLRTVGERAGRRNREGEGRGRVGFKRGKATRLVFGDGGVEGGKKRRRVLGAVLEGGEEVRAELTIVAAGAWSGALVDLRGRAEARGQVLAYVSITEEEKERLKDMPALLNLSTGMFAIPPVDNTSASPATQERGTANWAVKVARHAFGYANPTTVAPEGETIVTSLPAKTFSPIPAEGERACRSFLQKTIPWLGDRPFSSTRICWYTDTPTGNFLIDYHPEYEGLFLATGGSGHGFKFLPVLGDKIVRAVEGKLEEELRGLWRWPRERVLPFKGCEDGSRMGDWGMVLEEEWAKGRVEAEGKGEGVRSML